MATSRDRPKSAPYSRLKNSKKTSKCQVFSFTVFENQTFYEKKISKKLHTQKNGPSGAPGPASASPWRAERGTLPKLSTFLSQLKGEPFGEKTNVRIKVSQCRKTERGDPLGFFNIHSVAKHQKIEGGKFLFSEKNLTVPKKLKGGPFGVFQHPFCRKTAKKIEGGTFGEKISGKSLAVPKKLEGGTLWTRRLCYVTRENRKNLFGSVR